MFAFSDEEPCGPQSVVAQVHFDEGFALLSCDPTAPPSSVWGFFSGQVSSWSQEAQYDCVQEQRWTTSSSVS